MSLVTYVEALKAQRKGWQPKREQLSVGVLPDTGWSVDRLDPEVFGPLLMRPKAEMTASATDAEIVSKEFVDAFSMGVGQLNESLRQPYQTGRWYSSSHGYRRQAATWADGDCRMSLMYTSFNITIDTVRYEVTAAAVGSTARAGIYTVDPLTLLPTALLAETVTGSTAAVGKVTITLTTALAVTGPTWLGLALLIEGGTPALSCDKCTVGTAMQMPYGWSAFPFSTTSNAKYALLKTGASLAMPAASAFAASSTSEFGSGLWVNRSA